MSSRLMRQPTLSAGALVLGLLLLGPTTSDADLLPYTQSFEAMNAADPGALGADGWLVYGNVFSPTMTFLYGYGPFPAPNGPPPAFSALATGQGGPTQELIQLTVFSDYENADHAGSRWIESNVFQERTVGAANVGQTWYFEFDAKRGDLAGATTASAFIKTLAPPTYALTNLQQVVTTAIPTTWERYSISLPITSDLVGQIFQFGFVNTAKNYEPSSVLYDNITFQLTPTVDVTPRAELDALLRLSVRGNPARARDAQVLAFQAPRSGRATVRLYGVSGQLVATLADGEFAAGVNQVTWDGADESGSPVAAGIYFAEVVTGGQRGVVRLQRLR